jgi:Transposase zinc-binding domain
VARPAFQVADVFRRHGQAYREANAGHLDRSQYRVMAAIEACRTAALGGHVWRCSACGHKEIAYSSCRDRHCPTCQGSAARAWLEARQADLLPVELCSVAIYVLVSAKSQDYSALTACLKEHKFLWTIEPLGHHIQGGLRCLICCSLVRNWSRGTN